MGTCLGVLSSFVTQSFWLFYLQLLQWGHSSKLTCLTCNILKITLRDGIRTLFTETAHPAIRTGAGVWSFTDATVLTGEPTDS